MNNFEDILKRHSIQIPIIQRDYAQGRQDKKVIEIRDIFLDTILDKLVNNDRLHLDFVYGSIKENIFIPLDGQQRLTTLFLLYLYFGKKEAKNIDFLQKFTYETRASSREFCQKLVRNEIDFSENDLVSNIENSQWFLAFWKNDPTIQSMLVMLDCIHKKFYQKHFFDKLKNITFEFFELEKFGLNDDLYIKMNARGKPLTEFENFKAKFEQFLGDKDEQIQLEFSRKIDNEWADFFWSYKDKNYLIDNAFMNYFYYITEMLYYKMTKDSKLLNEFTFQTIQSIYSDFDNITFLFKTLDNLTKIKNSFDILFSSNAYTYNKVALFDKDINLLESLINIGHKDRAFSIQKKFILFLLISYLVDFEINNNFKNFLRVTRNFIERIRNTKMRSLQYTPNFEYRELNKILDIFLRYIDKDIYSELLQNSDDWSHKEFTQEIQKAKLISSDVRFKTLLFELEDYKYLKGDIHNFISSDITLMQKYTKNLKKIFDHSDDSLIIRAMLTSGDCRFEKGGTVRVNNRYFFGKNGDWELFLTDVNLTKVTFFKDFILNFVRHGANLQQMVDDFLQQDNDNKTWTYYFVKYDVMLKNDDNLYNDNNFFAWYNDFDIEKMGGVHLGAYHINPYIRAVSIETNIDYACYNKGEDRSYLKVDNYIDNIFSYKRDWSIKISDKMTDEQINELINQFNLNLNDELYTLPVQVDENRIELMIKFIKHVESFI